MANNILLESGTGEVEVLEFLVNNKNYAINVIKVKEVIGLENVTALPQCHPAISGVMLSRNEIITVIDLNYVIEGTKTNICAKTKAIICEFNKIKVAFIIDDILAVHRIGWSEIRKPDDITANSLVIGNIVLDEKVIFLLDFEKIVTDISPNTGINENRIDNIEYKDRSHIKVILADDSALIRKLLRDTLIKAGFKSLIFFDDGQEVWDYLNDLIENKNENFTEDVQLLITDIEMPRMDGHTLTRKIKEHPMLNKLPVIIFSSLITEDLKHKGISVGADAQLSKPEIERLISVMDKYLYN